MKRGKNFYLYRTYQLLQSGKSIKEIGIEEFGFPEKTAKQSMNYYISPLKKLKYIEKVSYGVWKIIKKWDQKEIDKLLKEVKKTTRIGINQLEEVKIIKDVRGHAVQIKLLLPEDYRNWENRKKVFDYIGLNHTQHFIGGVLRGEKIEINNTKVHTYHKSIVVNLDEKSFLAETSKKSQSYALIEFLKIIKKLERMFNNSPLSHFGKYKFKVTRQHYALIKNALAKQYINKDKKLHCYASRGLWLLIDNSFGLEELEAVHPETAVEDNEKVKAHFNNIDKEKLDTIKEITPSLVKEKLENHDKIINKSMNVLEGYAEQIALHLEVEQKQLINQEEQLKTQKIMQSTLNEIRKKL